MALKAIWRRAALAALLMFEPLQAQVPGLELRKLTLEELMQIEVTSVSRRIERAAGAAAAIEVITSEDIRRSGAVTLPEVLRLAVGLQVAQDDGNSWAISARGFNATSANKLLVLIDGRTVYTPLFSGVFWDVQDLLVTDIDRIEIIRGPGATLWGANAVNGVINIMTKSSRATPGVLVTGGAGNELFGYGGLRFGGMIGDRTGYRAYSKYFYNDALGFAGGGSARDALRTGQVGFRSDWESLDRQNSVTIQGDAYRGLAAEAVRSDTDLSGGNVIGRWARTFPNNSDFRLQLYYDRTHRRVPMFFREERDTFDADFQHHLTVGAQHNVLWGAGYRITADRTRESEEVVFNPARRTSPLYSGFIQDDIEFLDNRLFGTIGTKVEHNDFTGIEFQPNVRVAWRPSEDQMVWGAISRAVRMPTRLDSDLMLTSGPVTFLGDPDFKSEKLLAYEIGYRIRPRTQFSLDAATFYNVYNDLRSQEPQPLASTIILLQNKLNARTYGAEITADYQVTSRWRLRGGYVFFGKSFNFDPDSRDTTGGRSEGNDPRNRFLIRSYLDLPRDFEFDTVLRFTSGLPAPSVPRYSELDIRFGWSFGTSLELSLIGRNLFDKQHPEFGSASPDRQEIQRSVYGRATWRF